MLTAQQGNDTSAEQALHQYTKTSRALLPRTQMSLITKTPLIDGVASTQPKRHRISTRSASSYPRSSCSSLSPEEASSASSHTINGSVCRTPYSACQLDHSSTEIRIFTLLPACHWNAPLAGRLQVVNLEPTAPRYEALSYTWGSPGQTSCLQLDDSSLEIGANLLGALLHLRHHEEPRDIWIDAICIDQASPLEKNHQVRQMYKIYSEAWRVLIWLGESDNASDYAMGRLGGQIYGSWSYEDAPPGGFQASQFWLANIFERSWWHRVWTLQEGLAAGPYTRLMCGNMSVGWQAFLENAHDGVANTAMEASGIGDYIRTCKRHQSQSLGLEHLFWSSTSREAADPRDYIYGLLGPVKLGIGASLLPDYTKPDTWAYQKAMITIMAEAGHLDFLLVRILQNDSTRPSWYLDFSKTEGLSAIRDLVRGSTLR